MTDEPRRFFIGAGTTHYPNNPDLDDREELAIEIERMTALFVNDLKYERVSGFGPNLSAADLKAGLGVFLTDPQRRDSDLVVFYYTGHGKRDRDV